MVVQAVFLQMALDVLGGQGGDVGHVTHQDLGGKSRGEGGKRRKEGGRKGRMGRFRSGGHEEQKMNGLWLEKRDKEGDNGELKALGERWKLESGRRRSGGGEGGSTGSSREGFEKKRKNESYPGRRPFQPDLKHRPRKFLFLSVCKLEP
jgi:hypothetical protein